MRKAHLTFSVIFCAIAVSLTLPVPVTAAVQYSRSPTGPQATSPLTINVSFDDFEADTQLLLADCPTWSVEVSDNTNSYYPNNTVPNSIKTGTFIVNLPSTDYRYVAFSCNTEGGGGFLEGNGSPVIFSIAAPIIPRPPGSGITSYPPEVAIIRPTGPASFSSEMTVEYKATDKNDLAGGQERQELGMSDTPVSLFYSDKVAVRDHSLIKDIDKTLIAKNLPAAGSYTWDVKSLIPGVLYRLIVDAVDAIGFTSEDVSDFFTVDFTPPSFIVTANPAVAKNEDVTITVEPSEELSVPPDVLVRQRGGPEVKVEMSQDKNDRTYSGVYSVLDGYDGTALIKVSGSDPSGNKGTVVTGGGTFSVGVNPPAKPAVIYPADNEKVLSDTLEIRGTSREDVELTATVNGTEDYKAEVNSGGEFSIKDVRLKKDTVNGLNVINVAAKDRAGSIGEAAVIRVYLNSAPTLTILTPEQNAVLTATGTVAVKAADDNGDRVRYRYEMTPDGRTPPEEKDWLLLADTLNDNTTFNTAEWGDGAYLLRVTADDGATTTSAGPVSLRIKNELPFIGFDDGRQTAVSSQTAVVRGLVSSPDNLSPRPNITRMEYSLNEGRRWVTVAAQDGYFNSPEDRFAVTLRDLKDGVNNIIWRVTDSRGFTNRQKHPVTVDVNPPEAPKVLSPGNGSILTEGDNEAKGKDKFSFTVRGRAEPGSTVYIEVSGRQSTGSAGTVGEKSSARVAPDGAFRVKGVSLSARGRYVVKLYAVDEALNRGPSTELALIYDNPPALVFTNPRDGRGVGKTATLSWVASDRDGGAVLSSVLSYRKLGQPFVALAVNPKENKFDWDTTGLPEGNDYELKLEAGDGLATSTIRVPFSVDHNPPSLSEFSLKQNTFGKGGIFEAGGRANDDGSGVEFIEYKFTPADPTTAGTFPETPWYKGDIKRGIFGSSVSFSIKSPLTLSDGEYRALSRAVDLAGNHSSEKSQTIYIDATPPRVGSLSLASGATTLLPKDKAFSAPQGTKLSLTLSLESDAKSAVLSVGPKQMALKKNLATGLWQSDFIVPAATTSTLLVSAEDKVGNKSGKKEIASLRGLTRGRVTFVDEKGAEEPLSGATISIFFTDQRKNFLSRWIRAKPEETRLSGEDGSYDLLLSAGTYRIVAEKSGFETKEMNNVVLTEPAFVTDNFILTPAGESRSILKRLLEVLHLKK